MPASGGLATIHEECAGLSGDIRAVHKDAEFLTSIFVIECKTGYPRTSFWQHFKEIKNFNIELFWLQTLGESMGASKLPMLVYRKKGNKPLVCVDKNTSKILEKNTNIQSISHISMYWPKKKNIQPIYIYDFEKFLNIVTPDDIKEIGETLKIWHQ
jgi:hypothetical protein